MRWNLVAFAALVAALVFSFGSTDAYNFADPTPRAVSAAVVSTASAYNGLTIVTCNGNALSATTCSGNLVTNKGTLDDEVFRIIETEDSGSKVSQYGIDGGSKVASGYTGWSGLKDIGQTAAFNLDLVACGTLTGCASTKTYQTYWTVEGQKSGSLDFTATRVQITIQYP